MTIEGSIAHIEQLLRDQRHKLEEAKCMTDEADRLADLIERRMGDLRAKYRGGD